MPSTTFRAKGSHASARLVEAHVPMSERQQMALLMQMTSNDQLGFANELTAGSSNEDVKSASGPSPRRRRLNERGETPLHVAAIKGDEQQVRRLIADMGADPNAKDFAGWTPLHEACNKGWYGVANALLEAGATVNARGYDDITPLHDAAVNGHAKLVRLLVSSGADVTQRNRRGKTPGDEAAPGLDSRLFRDSVYDSKDNIEDEVTSYWSVTPSSIVDSDSELEPTNCLDGAVPCEMRRIPQNHKGEGKSSSPRVTLRLHQLKTRDEKRRNPPVSVLTYFTDTMEGKPKNEDAPSDTKSKEELGQTVPEAEKLPSDSKSEEEKPVNTPADETSEPVGIKKTSVDLPLSGTKRTAVDQGSVSTKRSLTESNEGAEEADDENKKKKRRDSDAGKEGTRSTAPGRPVAGKTAANDKTVKPATSTKTANAVTTSKLGSNVSTGDRKSPVSSLNAGSSPKPASCKLLENEEDSEDLPLTKSMGNSEGGPKVPPLKIVIPQQSATLEQEQGIRNGKNGKGHQALPYVVASSNNSNDSISDKDGPANAGSANPSPTECGTGSKVGEEKKDPLCNLTAEERSSHQRVLRSSHRSGGSSSSSSSSGGHPSGGSAPAGLSTSNNAGSNASSPQPGSSNNSVGDRNSNNSSPHQSSSQRQSPLPDAVVPVTEALPDTNVTKITNTCITPPVLEIKQELVEPALQPSNGSTQSTSVELHPRKRKLKQSKESQVLAQTASTSTNEPVDTANEKPEIHPHEQPITNCYQLFLDIRKQIERRRKGLFPVQPKPPSGFKDYLMNRCTYVLAGNSSSRLSIPNVTPPQTLQGTMKDLFAEQEKERYRLRMQHVIEKEKLVLSVEQEILRVHGRAARALANQSLPFSVCTILKDEEVYNVITPEQEEKDRNARSRYNGRLFISWLQDVDDKWEKIKESMLLRHHNEAESLHAVQKMDWEWKMKELGICEFKAKPVIEELHVPMVHVSDDFDLLPA